MNETELLAFCTEWLEAWTGNDPDTLVAYYADNALYTDPAHRKGLEGKEAIRKYFGKLLVLTKSFMLTNKVLPYPYPKSQCSFMRAKAVLYIAILSSSLG